jgi:hypothetical protein
MMPSKVKVVLRDYRTNQTLDYDIATCDHELSQKWIVALKELLSNGNILEKNYCWHGWPNSPRTLEYLCDELNRHTKTINMPHVQSAWINAGLEPYIIEEYFTPDAVRFPNVYGMGMTEDMYAKGLREELALSLALKHGIMNSLHNHFEILQGTVEQLSPYYKHADDDAKWAIRQLNNICHEIESLCLSQRKKAFDPEWIRPSQITTWLSAPRYNLTATDRELFNINQYDREFGGVYMHWCQIGKTLYEVYRDEHAPRIDKTTCDAITELQYYSGEFDIEWGRNVTRHEQWHRDEMYGFDTWLRVNGYTPNNAELSLGYLPLGQVDLQGSFGTKDFQYIIDRMGNYLDIYKVEVDGVSATYNYHWSDWDWREKQIKFLQPGYRFSSNV